MRIPRRLLLLGLAVSTACAPTPKHRLAVATIVDGDPAKVGLVEPHAIAGLELRTFTVPVAPAGKRDEAAMIVTRARAAYVDGDFDACRNELAHVDLARLLAAGERALASRTLAFDAACAYGAEAPAEAQAIAAKLASLGLDLPDAPLARDVEMVLAAALGDAGKLPRHALAVTGESGGRLAIDGRGAGCTLPCTVDVPPGDHLVAVDAEGFAPASRWVRVPEHTTIAIAQTPANPEVATRQWRARIDRGLPASDAIGARLLAQILGQPRVVYLHGGSRVSGTMIIEGAVGATGDRAAGDTPPLIRELAYDAGVLERPALWQRPSFWIATSLAVAVAAAIVVYAIYEPDVESTLEFPKP